MSTRPQRLVRNLLIAFAATALVACGAPEDGGVSGASVDAGGGGDGSLGGDDDTAVADNDTGPQDVGAVDTGPEDSGATVADTGPEDTGPEDTGPEDTGPIDAGAPDLGPPDTGPKDAGPGALCNGYAEKFTGVANAARQCKTPFSCTELAAGGSACPGCELFYSHDDMAKVQGVHDVASEAKQKKCAPKCPSKCADPDKDVGVCASGSCTFDAPDCKEIEKRFKLAIDEAHKCTSDAECSFQAQTSLPCGCGAYLNVKTMGPGKNLFRYAKMLVTVYNKKKCFSGACACPEFNAGKCVKGKCESYKK